jgi:hypothetical protein
VREHDAAVRKCIEDARSDGADVSGRIPITITVDGRGVVRHAAWVGNDVAHRAAARCIVGEVQRWNFPATGAEDETQVVYSFGAR